MNKKGFTLVEVLAVIVIMGLVAVIGFVSFNTIKSTSNKQALAKKVELIIHAAELYGNDNDYNLPSQPIKVSLLLTQGYLKSEEKDDDGNQVIMNDYNGKSLNDLDIKIYENNHRITACVVKNDALLGSDFEHIDLCED